MDKSIGEEATFSGGLKEEAVSFEPGFRMGQYKIIRLLGYGGMGQVYEAEHQALNRRYALKFLRYGSFQREMAIEGLRRQAHVMANMDHPNLLKADDFGENDGVCWLRMELVSGFDASDVGGESLPDGAVVVSLKDLISSFGKRLPERLLAVLLRQILCGLGYAHRQGVIHRDLKPSNILLTLDAQDEDVWLSSSKPFACPVAKISDFDLVELIDEQWRVASEEEPSKSIGSIETMPPVPASGKSSGSVVGTYEYMSPEQRQGDPVDKRTDLYALGVMTYRLLTGQELSLRQPTQVDAALNPGWNEFVTRALEVDPALRFQSAEEMAKALPVFDVTKTDGNLKCASDALAEHKEIKAKNESPENEKSQTTNEFKHPELMLYAVGIGFLSGLVMGWLYFSSLLADLSGSLLSYIFAGVLSLGVVGCLAGAGGGGSGTFLGGIIGALLGALLGGAIGSDERGYVYGVIALLGAVAGICTGGSGALVAGALLGLGVAWCLIVFVEWMALVSDLALVSLLLLLLSVGVTGVAYAVLSWVRDVRLLKRLQEQGEIVAGAVGKTSRQMNSMVSKNRRRLLVCALVFASIGLLWVIGDQTVYRVKRFRFSLAVDARNLENAEALSESLLPRYDGTEEVRLLRRLANAQLKLDAALECNGELLERFGGVLWKRAEALIQEAEKDGQLEGAVVAYENALISLSEVEKSIAPYKERFTSVIKEWGQLSEILKEEAPALFAELEAEMLTLNRMEHPKAAYKACLSLKNSFSKAASDYAEIVQVRNDATEDYLKIMERIDSDLLKKHRAMQFTKIMQDVLSVAEENTDALVIAQVLSDAGARLLLMQADVLFELANEAVKKNNWPEAFSRAEQASVFSKEIQAVEQLLCAILTNSTTEVSQSAVPVFSGSCKVEALKIFGRTEEKEISYMLASGSDVAMEAQKRTARRLNLPVEIRSPRSGICFRLIPSGDFLMGSSIWEKGRQWDEKQHKAFVPQPFYCAVFETTLEQWSTVMGTKHNSKDAAMPVSGVSRDECMLFLQKLCEVENVPPGTYALLTETEWEYACRAGTKTPFVLEEGLGAGVAGVDGSRPYGRFPETEASGNFWPTGRFMPNAYGLYDMHGNVAEWCADRYRAYGEKSEQSGDDLMSTEFVVRGGAWSDPAEMCRSAARARYVSSQKVPTAGFRIKRIIFPSALTREMAVDRL